VGVSKVTIAGRQDLRKSSVFYSLLLIFNQNEVKIKKMPHTMLRECNLCIVKSTTKLTLMDLVVFIKQD
jgi:hypothetical protein